MTITSLIAGNSDRLGRRQSAAKPRNRKVQRLSREGVHSSEWKWEAPRTGEDIVLSAWKHVAVSNKRDGYLVAQGTENTRLFNGKPCIADSHCPANHIFYLNEDHLHLFVHKQEDFRMEPFQSPINQNIKVAGIFWMGALGSSNNRLHGVQSALTA